MLDADRATAAKVRVLVRTRDADEAWSTVGVSENILEASWQALADSINYKLNKERQNMACDALTREATKGKGQKAKGDAGEYDMEEAVA